MSAAFATCSAISGRGPCLILDEAHHAAPASGSRYAVDSQFTRAVRGLAERFEHRLFLSATPHNGHSNSFSSLLEILDPQRFTRGVPVRPRELDAVMVRRLKSDLRHFGEKFPERVVEPIRHRRSAGRCAGTRSVPQARRIWRDHPRPRGKSPAAGGGPCRGSTFVGLQQRLLSSIAAFARTLEVHRKGLVRADGAGSEAAAEAFVHGGAETEDEPIDEDGGREADPGRGGRRRPRRPGSLRRVFPISPWWTRCWRSRRKHAHRPDARIAWLAEWVRANMAPSGRWNERRLVLFTEYEDTRRWVEKRLAEALDDLQPDDRIASFTGATPTDPARGAEAALQRGSGTGSAAHPDLHRRRARRHQSPDALPRPHPHRSSLEPGAPGAAERPHRPQAAAVVQRSGAAISSTSSARRTSSCRRWCGRRS